jgi:hypothetical protein
VRGSLGNNSLGGGMLARNGIMACREVRMVVLLPWVMLKWHGLHF